MNAAQHIAHVTQTHNLTREALLGPSKAAAVSRPRQELYLRLAVIRGLSLPVASRLVGKRDHTTALYGLRRKWHELTGQPPNTPVDVMRLTWECQIEPGLKAIAAFASWACKEAAA